MALGIGKASAATITLIPEQFRHRKAKHKPTQYSYQSYKSYSRQQSKSNLSSRNSQSLQSIQSIQSQQSQHSSNVNNSNMVTNGAASIAATLQKMGASKSDSKRGINRMETIGDVSDADANDYSPFTNSNSEIYRHNKHKESMDINEMEEKEMTRNKDNNNNDNNNNNNVIANGSSHNYPRNDVWDENSDDKFGSPQTPSPINSSNVNQKAKNGKIHKTKLEPSKNVNNGNDAINGTISHTQPTLSPSQMETNYIKNGSVSNKYINNNTNSNNANNTQQQAQATQQQFISKQKNKQQEAQQTAQTKVGRHRIRFENKPAIKLNEIVDLIDASIIKRLCSGKDYGVAVITEGIVDMLDESDLNKYFEGSLHRGHELLGFQVRRKLVKRWNKRRHELFFQNKFLGFELRSDDPNAHDIILSRNLGYAAVFSCKMKNINATIVAIKGGELVSIPLSEMMDPFTLSPTVKGVNIDSLTYTVAQSYMIKLKKADLKDTNLLKKMSDIAGMDCETFRKTYSYIAS